MDMGKFLNIQKQVAGIIETLETFKQQADECKLMGEQISDLWFLAANLFTTSNELRDLWILADFECAERTAPRG